MNIPLLFLNQELAASAGESDVKSLVSSIVSGVLAGASAGSKGHTGHYGQYGHKYGPNGHNGYGNNRYNGQKDTYHASTTYGDYNSYGSPQPVSNFSFIHTSTI